MQATMKAPAKGKKKALMKKVKKVSKFSRPKLKAKKAAKQHVARSERDDVPCCVNYRRKLLDLIDKKAEKTLDPKTKKPMSRSKFLQAIAAKAVGFKVAS